MTEGNFSSIPLHIENKQKALKEYDDRGGKRVVKEFTVATTNVSLNICKQFFSNNHFTQIWGSKSESLFDWGLTLEDLNSFIT